MRVNKHKENGASKFIAFTTVPSDRDLVFEDQSPFLTIRGHPCNNRQFVLSIISENFTVSELTFVSTLLIFSLVETRDRSPAGQNFSLAFFTRFIQLTECTLNWFLAPFYTIDAFRSNWNVRVINKLKKRIVQQNNRGWEFTKTITSFALVGYEVIITNSHYALVGYLSPRIQHKREWNNCYISILTS